MPLKSPGRHRGPAPPGNPWPKKLRKLRSDWGADGKPLTQELAAERIGVTRRSWISWELGQQIPAKPVQVLVDLLLKQN